MHFGDEELTAIYQSILAEPGADLHRLIYADRCEEIGQEERAKFIRAQLAGGPTWFYNKWWNSSRPDWMEAPVEFKAIADFLMRRGFIGRAEIFSQNWLAAHARMRAVLPIEEVILLDALEIRLLVSYEPVNRFGPPGPGPNAFRRPDTAQVLQGFQIEGLPIISAEGADGDIQEVQRADAEITAMVLGTYWPKIRFSGQAARLQFVNVDRWRLLGQPWQGRQD